MFVTTKALSHRDILQVAIPMIIGNISVPLSGIVDTAVMGHLDQPYYLGGVAISAVIFNFLFWAFGFLRLATTGSTAQAFGQNNQRLLEISFLQPAILAITIALLIVALQAPIKYVAFTFMQSSDLVYQQALIYFDIRIWSTPAILLNYVLLGWFIGKQASKHALILVLTVTLSNMLLDIVFVVGLEMTANGVALASVVAEYLGLGIGLHLLKQHGVNRDILSHIAKRSINFLERNWLALNGNIFIRTLLLMFSFAFFTAQSAKEGDIVLAANSVLLHFLTLMSYFLDGFANATEVFTGKAQGQKNKAALKRALLLTCFWSFIVAALFSLSYWLFGHYIITMMTSIDSVIHEAKRYLTWLVIMPIIAVWAYVFDGLFVGTTRSKEMRDSMFIAVLVCYLPAWYFLQPLGNDGLWFALLILLAARGVIQRFYLKSILNFK
jgi:MATE family multidrug resistance protein